MGIAQLDRVLTDEQIADIVEFLNTLTGYYGGRPVRSTTQRASAATP
jgi:cytochrome c peroxidase